MEIAIFRHGHSLSVAESAADSDYGRILSSEGRDEVKRSAVKLKNEGFSTELIFSSPLKRAHETSLIIGDVFNIKSISVSELLKPSTDISEIINLIKNNSRNIILVSHIPVVEDILHSISGSGFSFTSGSYVRVLIDGKENAKIISKYTP
jgi:phosphohistidine phosphatase SixA